jgi:hypothetical protein
MPVLYHTHTIAFESQAYSLPLIYSTDKQSIPETMASL